MPKNWNFKFHYSFGRDRPKQYMNFGEKIWCVLSEEMSFETFAAIWPHINENKKKNWQKNEI